MVRGQPARLYGGLSAVTESHEMDRYLGLFQWNDLSPDEQEMIGYGMREAAKALPGWLTQKELEDIAQSVRNARVFRTGVGSIE